MGQLQFGLKLELSTLPPLHRRVMVFFGIRFAGNQLPAVNSDGTAVLGSVASPRFVIVDLTRPSVEITGVPTQTQTGAFEVTITFGEDVTGF